MTPIEERAVLLSAVHPYDMRSARRWLAAALHFYGYRVEWPTPTDSNLVSGFHWDTRGDDIVNRKGEPAFSPREAKRFDRNLACAFDIIDEHDNREGGAYAFVNDLLACADCNLPTYYDLTAPAEYRHLDPEAEPCFLIQSDERTPSRTLKPEDGGIDCHALTTEEQAETLRGGS